MAKKIKNILFTSDLTADSRYVFEFLLEMADQLGADITTIHVLEGTAPSGTIHTLMENFLSPDQLAALRQQHKMEALTSLVGKSRHQAILRDSLELITKSKADHLPNGVFQVTDVIVAEGDKVEEITKAAHEKKCDLIVLGSRHLSGSGGVFKGGTSQALLKNAPGLSVLIVPIPKKHD